MPVSWFRKSTDCRNRSECARRDPLVRKQLVDLHNLIPVVGEINGARSDKPFGVVTPNQRYRFSPVEVTKSVVEPPNHIKGLIARSTLYMVKEYDIITPIGYVDLMRIWDKAYPATRCEVTAREQIKQLQP